MNNARRQRKVERIVVLNPYLQRGLRECAEVESTTRFVTAARNLGINAIIVGSSADIPRYDPDFVVTISHQEPKLTHYPTYGLLAAPLNWMQNSARFLRNIFSYDGYMAASPSIHQWIHQLCQMTNKELHVADATFSVPKTEFIPIDFRKAQAIYLGTNWDGMRHHDIFQYFADGEYLKCFGPKRSWEKYPPALYGGMVPFDGHTALATYANHGIGLCINHPDFDNEDIPSNRTFEIPAASALAICANNPYTKSYYGDSVLYIDKNLPTKAFAESIKDQINWVRSNPDKAQEMARCAHAVFNRKLAMENFIERLIGMHYDFIESCGYVRQSHSTHVVTIQDKVTYLIPVDNIDSISNVINDIQHQTYHNVDIVLLTNQNCNEVNYQLGLSEISNIHVLQYMGINSNHDLLQYLIKNQTKWICVVKNEDRLSINHAAYLLKIYNNSKHDKSSESTVVLFSNSLEYSDNATLKDKFQDGCMLYIDNKVRVGNLTPMSDIPLCAALFKLTNDTIKAFYQIDFVSNLRVELATSLVPLDVAIHANAITCSAFVGITKKDGLALNGEVKKSVLIISNATTSVPVIANNHAPAREGRLLST